MKVSSTHTVLLVQERASRIVNLGGDIGNERDSYTNGSIPLPLYRDATTLTASHPDVDMHQLARLMAIEGCEAPRNLRAFDHLLHHTLGLEHHIELIGRASCQQTEDNGEISEGRHNVSSAPRSSVHWASECVLPPVLKRTARQTFGYHT